TLPPGPPPPPQTQEGADQETLVLAQRPISAASSFSVQARDFELRPIGSVQDILRVTPGLVMVQHSGGGKANQYFLRGFDADHGTDIAFSIDGIPINMVSHAHGQGFSDTNFIIPETVERVEITKGPYFADQGDFDTAGSVNLVTRENMEHSSIGFGVGGSPGYGGPSYRGLLIASPTFSGPDGGTTKTLFAAEVGRQDGPFENPEQWDKYKLFNKVTFELAHHSQLTIGEASYASSWHGSGQIPSRAVDSGLINRFGSVDPTEGGDTGRHQLFVTYKMRPTEKSQIDALVYAGTYRFNLYSNFTLYLDDPVSGDEIEQIDRRFFYGGKASYKIEHDLRQMRFITTIGAQSRNDDIHEELWHTRERVQLNQERGNDVHESMLGVYANEEVQPVKWLRVVGGLRGDYLGFSVDNRVSVPGAPESGEDGAHQFSPKASVIVTPVDVKNAQVDIYGNYGNGFHSNDVRGVFSTPAVTPLTRAIGEEAGSRARLFKRWDLAVALWRLTLDNETTWDGDDGTTSVAGETLRYGIEMESRFEITKWLAADGALTLTHSQFSTDNENGGGLALAPKQTWSGGLSARHELGPGAIRGGLRFYG
ncbi:MAG: TonB-dependent receptor, partial [Polyangiaceae bacterium]